MHMENIFCTVLLFQLFAWHGLMSLNEAPWRTVWNTSLEFIGDIRILKQSLFLPPTWSPLDGGLADSAPFQWRHISFPVSLALEAAVRNPPAASSSPVGAGRPAAAAPAGPVVLSAASASSWLQSYAWAPPSPAHSAFASPRTPNIQSP